MKRHVRPMAALYAATFLVALVGAAVWPPPADPTATVRAVRHTVTAPAASTPPAPQSNTAVPARHWSESPQSDVIAERYPPVRDVLDALRAGETVHLPGPDGATIGLRVDEVRSGGRSTHLRLSRDALASTATVFDGEFFATIATPTGVYALSGDGQSTWLLRHDILNLRNLHAFDYRPAPT